MQALGRSLRSLSRAAGRRIRQPRCVQDINATSRPDYRVGIQKESCVLNPVKLATALLKTGVKQRFQAHLYPIYAQTSHSSPENRCKTTIPGTPVSTLCPNSPQLSRKPVQNNDFRHTCIQFMSKLATALLKTGAKQRFQAHLYPLLAQTRHSSSEEIFSSRQHRWHIRRPAVQSKQRELRRGSLRLLCAIVRTADKGRQSEGQIKGTDERRQSDGQTKGNKVKDR